MIAMALAKKPSLLIADEPTTALDVTIQAQILELMKEIKDLREDAAIVLITHDLAVIAETCERVIVMYGGKIQEVAEVIELFENPLHPYTQGLLNSIPRPELQKKERLQAIRGMVPNILNFGHVPNAFSHDPYMNPWVSIWGFTVITNITLNVPGGALVLIAHRFNR